MGKYRDLTGQTFGRLTCIKDIGRRHGKSVWICRCACGNEAEVIGAVLISGAAKSCGCLRKEMLVKKSTVHSLRTDENGKTPRLYAAWRNMKRRCYDSNAPDYENYGGRGIKVCDEWQEYKAFHGWAVKHGYDDSLTIERTDNNGDYEPGNCKWIALGEQAKNKRNNRVLTYRGKSMILSEWSRLLGISPSALRKRLELGWSVSQALTVPTNNQRRA